MKMCSAKTFLFFIFQCFFLRISKHLVFKGASSSCFKYSFYLLPLGYGQFYLIVCGMKVVKAWGVNCIFRAFDLGIVLLNFLT